MGDSCRDDMRQCSVQIFQKLDAAYSFSKLQSSMREFACECVAGLIITTQS